MTTSAAPLPLLDNTRRMKLAQLAKTLQAGAALLGVGAFAWQYHLIRQIDLGLPSDLPTLRLSDSLARVSTVVELLLMVFGLIALIRWQLRAYENVHRLPGTAPRFGSGAAGWGWFVPIVSFWIPYRVMAEIGRYIGGFGSSDDGAVRSRWDVLLVLWWVLHIGEILFARVLFHSTSADTVPELLTATRLQLGGQILSLLTSLTLLLLLRLLAPAERALLRTPPPTATLPAPDEAGQPAAPVVPAAD